MNNNFEGYIGIRLGEEQLANDILFSLLLVLLIGFAFVFRANYSLFVKMLKDIGNLKERQNLFEKVSGNEFFFGKFMIFQPLFLCAIAFFCYIRSQRDILYTSAPHIFLTIGAIFVLLLLFYFFRQCIYTLLGYVFAEPDKYKLWRSNYRAVIETWGVCLYIPVTWLIFMESVSVAPIVLFVFFYFLCRFVIIYNTFRIFYRKNSGVLYLSLYLCSQEILPLVFLYKGLLYLYNFIGASTLWH